MKKIRISILKMMKASLVIIPKLVPDILAIMGAVSISYGAYLFLKPLGFILSGIMLIAAAVVLSKSS